MNLAARRLAEQFDEPTQQRAAAVLGMWVFLASEVLFFGVLFAGYAYVRLLAPAAIDHGGAHSDLLLGTLETIALLSSSMLGAGALAAIERARPHTAAALLLGAAALGTAFLAMHGMEYLHDYRQGRVPGLYWQPRTPQPPHAELYYALYFAITGFHGLHVAIGVVALAAIAWCTLRGAFDAHWHTPLELTTLYWHLVDVVWIFVFPLLYLPGRHP